MLTVFFIQLHKKRKSLKNIKTVSDFSRFYLDLKSAVAICFDNQSI